MVVTCRFIEIEDRSDGSWIAHRTCGSTIGTSDYDRLRAIHPSAPCCPELSGDVATTSPAVVATSPEFSVSSLEQARTENSDQSPGVVSAGVTSQPTGSQEEHSDE